MKFLKIVFALFFVISAGVHVYGLFTHFNNESNISHTAHVAGYLLCAMAIAIGISKKWFSVYLWLVYLVGAAYPFYYHATCFISQVLLLKHTINYICLAVIVVIPLGFLLLKKPLNK